MDSSMFFSLFTRLCGIMCAKQGMGKGNDAMLKIVFGEVENAVYHPPTYFDNQYEDEWITDPLTVAMVKDVDKSDVVGVHLIQSPVLGPISVKEISGGVKTLILMAFDKTDQGALKDEREISYYRAK